MPTVNTFFIDASTGKAIGQADMPVEHLPQSCCSADKCHNQKVWLLPRSARVKEEQDAHKKWPAKQTAEGCLVCARWTHSPECD